MNVVGTAAWARDSQNRRNGDPYERRKFLTVHDLLKESAATLFRCGALTNAGKLAFSPM
jgi:hypothetical protein